MREQTTIIRKGTFQINSIVTVLLSLARIKDVQLTWGDVKKERSDPQNNALYGVAYKALSEFTGYTGAELHEVMLRAYFGEVEREVMGKTIITPRRRTTTDENGRKNKLTTLEFAAFYSFIQQKGAEIGCWVPDPDPMFHLHQQERAA